MSILYLTIVIVCIVLTITLVLEHIKKKEIIKKHNLLVKYLKESNELIEKYNTTIHKYKNNLIAIKAYIKTDFIKTNEYIDNLLKNYKIKEYRWLVDINYIYPEIFKYLVYDKLSIAEENNLKIGIMISKDLKLINNNFFDIHKISLILDIMGEYFDNAVYASLESSKKELNLELYLEDENLVFILTNTYQNKIDLTKLTKKGYSTKGKQHGLGLYDIDKIIKNNPYLKNEYQIQDDYFIVKLIINLKR